MRRELTQLLSMTDSVVIVTGDKGTGKSSLLVDHQTSQSVKASTIAPSPSTCTYDSGALQVAILDGLVSALTASSADRSTWRKIQHRIDNAGKQMAVAVGKSLAKAVAAEVMTQVKARLGEHAGEGISTFFRSLREDPTEDFRKDLQSRTDDRIVTMLLRLCDEVALVLKRNLVLAIDECQHLTDDDQRILLTLAGGPPKRTRFVFAWSSAEPQRNLTLILETGAGQVEVGGLDRDEIVAMLRAARIDDVHADRVMFLSNGFPIIVEGLIGQLRSGGSINDYTPPTAFVRTLEDALARLPLEAQVVARQLAIFELPPSEATVAAYLGVTATQWGVLRNLLERENILSVNRNGQLWFHETRRSHVWGQMLSDEERYEIGQPAYSALLTQYRESVASSAGLMVTIAHTARYALGSQETAPVLSQLLKLTPSQLAVLASVIELEITDEVNGAHWTPPETALIYAHNTFGARRLDALDALKPLLDEGLIEEVGSVGNANADPNISCTLSEDETDECQIVLRGLISDVLGKAVVAQVTGRVVHEQYEVLRLQSSRVLSDPGQTDVVDFVRRVDKEIFHRFDLRDGSVCPMLAVTVDYGGQPVSMAAIFNSTDDRNAAKKSAVAVDEVSYGRRIKTLRTFEDQISTIPSQKLFQAAYLASGRPVQVNNKGEWWMLNPGPPLPIREYALRQTTLAGILRTRLTSAEKDIYALREPRGCAVGRAPDGTYVFVDLRGTTQVVDLTADQIELIQNRSPFLFAHLEHHLALRPGERTHLCTGRSQPAGLIDDPVVNLMASFWRQARDFNKHQPRYRIKARAGALTQALRAAHVEKSELARTLSEQLTIGGMRGHRPQRGLNVAVHLGQSESASMVAYAQPIGDPSDVRVRLVAPTVSPDDVDELYLKAFGVPSDDDEVYGGPGESTIANLLGYDDDEIALIR